jgi:hypothetical protein
MLAQPVIGRWLDFSHEAYAPLFFVAGSMYLVALLVIHLLLPRFEQQQILGEAGRFVCIGSNTESIESRFGTRIWSHVFCRVRVSLRHCGG